MMVHKEHEVSDNKKMIYYNIPWNTEKNIGLAYNQFMEMLGEEDYACFIDADACFTTTFFGKQLEDIVVKYYDTGVFTCLTNRIMCPWQKAKVDWKNNDIAYHREAGKKLYDSNYDDCRDATNCSTPMSGMVMLIKKSSWQRVGGFKKSGIIGIDNDFHRKCKKHKEKVYLMKGVYVYHWYRGGDIKETSHLRGN